MALQDNSYFYLKAVKIPLPSGTVLKYKLLVSSLQHSINNGILTHKFREICNKGARKLKEQKFTTK